MERKINEIFKGKTIAITGGLGSIGSKIIDSLLKYNPRKILLIDNRETGLFYAGKQYSKSNLETFFCDVREKERLTRILKNTDVVFHAAAMKHVIICEKNPFETIRTNVIGTQNVIEVCLNNQVEKMILISTDKAVNPTNVMGATKLLAERLVSAMSNISNKETKFGIVRFGNVLYSRGSVLEIWEKQLSEGKKITITDPDMTRFFMDIPQSVEMIFNAAYYAESGETFIFKMPSIRMGTLAEAFLEFKGYTSDYYQIVGSNVGEKLHEDLIFEAETNILMENNKFFLRLPLESRDISAYRKKGFRKSKIAKLRSNDPQHILNKESIKKVLKHIKFIT